MPGTHARLAPHEVGDVLKLFGVDISVTVKIEHLEGDLEVAPRRRQHRQEEHVVRKGDEATCSKS